MALTAKQTRFVDEYLRDLNATQAAIRAGYSAKTAEQLGYQLLQHPSVSAEIECRQKKLAEKLEVTVERVLTEYARIAFQDPRKLLNEDGTPKALSELDDDTAAVIAGLDVSHIRAGESDVGTILKYKLADKKGALDSLARHLGMFKDSLELKGKITLEDLVAGSAGGVAK